MREVMLAPNKEKGIERRRAGLAAQLRDELKLSMDEDGASRLWRSYRPRFVRRDVLTFWLPLAVVCLLAISAAYWTEIRNATVDTAEGMRNAVVDHPEFAVKRIEITGRKATPRDFVLQTLKIDGSSETVSSLDFDVAAARDRLIRSPWIEDASVALDPTGTLRLRLDERSPAAIWRSGEKYWLIDGEGQPISAIADPGKRLDLPYLLGKDANEAVADARALLLSVPPRVADEVLALVRRGGRRWDVVTTYGYVVKLPEKGALDALRLYGEKGYGARLKPLAVVALDLRRPDEPAVLQLETGTNDLRLEALATLRKPDKK